MLKWNEISSSAKERNKKSSSDIYVGKLIDVKERSRAERKPLAYVHSRHVTSCKTNRFNTCTRAPKTLSPVRVRPARKRGSDTRRTIPSRHRKNRQKLPFASMLFLCQHSHYVSANSKPLLYLFSRL